MNQSSTVDKLETSMRLLLSKWDSTCTEWNDVVSAYFEKTYLVTIKQQTSMTLAKMQELSNALLKAQKRVQ